MKYSVIALLLTGLLSCSSSTKPDSVLKDIDFLVPVGWQMHNAQELEMLNSMMSLVNSEMKYIGGMYPSKNEAAFDYPFIIFIFINKDNLNGLEFEDMKESMDSVYKGKEEITGVKYLFLDQNKTTVSIQELTNTFGEPIIDYTSSTFLDNGLFTLRFYSAAIDFKNDSAVFDQIAKSVRYNPSQTKLVISNKSDNLIVRFYQNRIKKIIYYAKESFRAYVVLFPLFLVIILIVITVITVKQIKKLRKGE